MLVRGTQAERPPAVDKDSSPHVVYLRSNIVRVDEEGEQGFHGWEYEEEVISQGEYMSRVVYEQESKVAQLQLALAESEESRLESEENIMLALAELAEGGI